jgi:uncharacterized protein YjbI with pentapeptide repeats
MRGDVENGWFPGWPLRRLPLAAWLCSLLASAASGDIYQWQWVDPNDHSLGKTQSNILCPDGAGISPAPQVFWDQRDLNQAYLFQSDLSHGFLNNDNLVNAYLSRSNLTSLLCLGCSFSAADLSQVNARHFYFDQGKLDGANLAGATLTNIRIQESALDDANFTNADLSNSSINFSRLYGADFTGATINGLVLEHATDYGLTASQIYSTGSYKTHDLQGLRLERDDLSGWDFSGQNLTATSFDQSNLSSARFTNATIAGVLTHTNLTDADFSGANLRESSLGYSTIHDANLTGANLEGVDFFAADLRGAKNADLSTARSTLNTIHPDGTVLGTTEALELFVHDYRGAEPIPIHVLGQVNRALIQLELGSGSWGSTISFAPGISVYIDNSELDVGFEDGVDPAPLVGRTWQIFDWTGVSPVGQFDFNSYNPHGYVWDTSRLYTDGTVTLIAVPEPSSLAVTATLMAMAGLNASQRLRHRHRRFKEGG